MTRKTDKRSVTDLLMHTKPGVEYKEDDVQNKRIQKLE